jgi:hypothetical protein
MSYHGGFLNLSNGAVVALRGESNVWRRMRRRLRRADKTAPIHPELTSINICRKQIFQPGCKQAG